MYQSNTSAQSELHESLRDALGAVAMKRLHLTKLSDYVHDGLLQTFANTLSLTLVPDSGEGKIVTAFRAGVYPCFTAEVGMGQVWSVTCHDENFVVQLIARAMELMQNEARTGISPAQESFYATLTWPGEQILEARELSRLTVRELPQPFHPKPHGDYFLVTNGVAMVDDRSYGAAQVDTFLEWNALDAEPVLPSEQKVHLLQAIVDSEGWFPYALQRESPNAHYGVLTVQQFTKGTFKDRRIAVVVGNYAKTQMFLRTREHARTLLPGQVANAKDLLEEFGAVAVGHPK